MTSILLLSAAPGYGGAERSLEIILGRIPTEIHICVVAESRLHVEEIKRLGRPNTDLVEVSTETEQDFVAAVRRVLKAFMRHRPTAILANTKISAMLLASAAPMLRRYEVSFFLYVRDFLWTEIEEIFHRLPDAEVLTPDRVVAERPNYLDRFVAPLGSRPLHVVPDMVEIGPATPLPQSDPPTILHLATINPWKGHAHLIEAMNILRARGVAVTGASYGYRGHPDLEAKLLAVIAQHDLASIVHLHPYAANPVPLLERCACVAVTSVSHSGGPETFGRTIIEAWAHARPVVAFAAGAPARLIAHEVDGLLVPEGDEAALADALARVIKDRRFAQTLAENGRARAQRDYHASVVTPSLLRLLMK